MEGFTPVGSFLGGVLIGLAAAAMLWINGKILGVSGIFGGLLNVAHGDTFWRVTFLAGLLLGGLLLRLVYPGALAFTLDRSTGAVIAAGLLVGIGTRLGNGCTSGHGVCGIGRIAPRSVVATGVFMATAIATAVFVGEVLGGRI